ncbi:MAG: hypothetical protein RPU15_00635 [Candidatus Sedimenticola sp. (ex Thyasira tokunagai)]
MPLLRVFGLLGSAKGGRGRELCSFFLFGVVMRSLLFVLLLLIVPSSFALTLYDSKGLGWFEDPQEACDAWASTRAPAYGWKDGTCTVTIHNPFDTRLYCLWRTTSNVACQTDELMGHKVIDDCPAGQSYDNATDSCVSPPEPCASNHEISVTTDGSMGLNFCFGGCAYDFSGVGVYTGGSWSGKLVSTGQTCSESDSAPPGDFGPVQDDHCVTNGGVTVCDGVPGDACSVVNGIEVCIDQQSPDDCGYVNGESLCADAPKNCGVFNGEVVCAEAPDLMHSECSPDGFGCMRDFNGKSLCMTHEGMQYEVSETVTNADGSKTTTTTTTDNIKGHGVKTTTETISADGTSTERTTTNSGDDPTGGEGEEEKEKEPDFSVGDKGSFDEGGLDTEIAAAKARFGTMISTIQSEAGTLFSFSSGSAGELPCWSVTIRETSYQMCLSDYSAQFSVIASGLLFISYLIGLAILFR